jgi:hypothetical protein
MVILVLPDAAAGSGQILRQPDGENHHPRLAATKTGPAVLTGAYPHGAVLERRSLVALDAG